MPARDNRRDRRQPDNNSRIPVVAKPPNRAIVTAPNQQPNKNLSKSRVPNGTTQPTTKRSNLKKPKSQNDLPVVRGNVEHSSQNTAMLAGQSLPTNTVQNLLVGRPTEHITENVLSLLREYYTDPAVMSRLPRMHQNDAVHRQLASFQRIIDEMESHFAYSPSRFHAILMAMINEAPHSKTMLRLGRLKELFEERVSDAQKVTGYLRDADKKTKVFFEKFLSEIRYHKRVKEYFSQRIYCALYQYYYDEFDDVAYIEDGYEAQLETLAKQNRTGAAKRYKNGKKSLPEGDLLLNNKDYLIGNYKSVNTWTEKRKLSYAVEHLFNLDKRWTALLDDNGAMDPQDFEPESSENMDQFSNYPAFEPILRLIPDLYVKARKAVELSTLWWTAGNKLFPANPDQMVERLDVLMRINDFRTRVNRLTDELANIDRQSIPHQQDLDALLARDDHFNRLAADYENLASMKRDKLERHQKLEDKVNELEGPTPYWVRRRAIKQQRNPDQTDYEEELRRARYQLSKSYRSLRLVAYQFEINSGDYLAELTIRPTFVRFLDTCQQRLTTSEAEVGERRTELTKLQRELNALVANYNRRRDTLEKYLFLSDETGNTRAAERSREALDKHQNRIHGNTRQNLDLRTISPPPNRNTNNHSRRTNINTTRR